jgi:non-ribosomal peptide synthetase component F/3-oxoacyl-(acyl-carrier-protein) synthase/thioesterase domain-containing protein/2-polyprenyl-3-methyl-5-hydroxy-6-metoxy-1,4-benzoquinol methylase/aryl carrier-like protein
MTKELIRTLLKGVKDGAIERSFGLRLLAQVPELARVDQRVAIIGMSCRFPGAGSKEAYWQNLRDGKDSVGPFPAQRRADVDRYLSVFDDRHFLNADPYFHGGYLDEVDKFDHEIFGMLPGECRYVAPEQRIFLEVALEAFEDGGYGQDALHQSATGVYVGNSGNQYGYLVEEPVPSSVAGNLSAFIASRVSYVFGLSGPSMMVSVGCSSSLLAVHLACQGLLSGDCEMALAGGVTLDLFPSNTRDHIWNMLGIARNDARCRAFDDSADGIAKGEGAGAVLLKPLARALADGDPIYAVLLASGSNQDGRSNGITAPNPKAQADLLEQTWRKARVDPRTLGYIEAHGTGTHLGDPIELKGLEWAFRRFTEERRFCAIGSVKTNIGHLADGAAGVAGLIKTVLALKHAQVPPSLHFETPNRNVDFDKLPVYVNSELRGWESGEGPRRAGVSAFGLCGTNVHVVLEEWREGEGNAAPAEAPFLYVLSAKSNEALLRTAQKHLAFCDAAGPATLNLRDVCYTLATGRAHHEHRLALIVESVEELRSELSRLLADWDGARRAHSREPQSASGAGMGALSDLRARYLDGEALDWESVYPEGRQRKLNLPTYGFCRQRFWLDAARLSAPMLGNLNGSAREGQQAEAQPRRELGARGVRPEDVGTDELRDIWRLCLGKDTFSETESLYRIGGDSLIAVQIATKLAQRHGVTIDLQQFFDASSFSEFAQLVKEGVTAAAGGTEPEAAGEPTVSDAPMERLPLTDAQRRLWVLDQLESQQVAYLVQGTFQLRGELDPTRLVRAVERTAHAHEAFRLEIDSDGSPFQRARPGVRIQVEQLDLSGVQDALSAALALARRRCQSPLPLDRAPLCRFQLMAVGARHWVFSYQIHHIIFDGWSHDLFFKEVHRRYRDAAGSDPLASDRIRADYADFVRAQRSAGIGPSASEQYWLAKLAGELPRTFIVGDKVRPSAFTFKGRTERLFFEASELQEMRRYCEREDVTLFVLLMASLNVLIHARSGASDVLVGMPVHGRDDARFHDTIGLFTNTLVLRQEVRSTMPFRVLLETIRRDAQLAIRHQAYPFDRLVEKLAVKKEPAFSPLFNINLAVQNARSRDKQEFQLDGVSLHWEPMDVASCKWDLAFDFVEFNAGLQLNLEYCADLYSAEFIHALVASYRAILGSVLTQPAPSVGQLTTASAPLDEQGSAVLSRFSRMVERAPLRRCLAHGEATMTYAELDLLSRQVSGLLSQQGAGQRVGILCTHGIGAVGAIMGTLVSGRTYVPLDPDSPFERLKSIVERAQIESILHTSTCVDLANHLRWQCPAVSLTVCCDSDDVFGLSDQRQNGLSEGQLWDYVGSKAADDIQGGGWVSSYTGQPFSREEMDEYAENVWRKVSPFINANTRILEIGCSSGITLFRLARTCREYVAIDVSAVILDANRERAEREGLASKVRFYQLEASQLASVSERDFDVVIINSVIHCFSGYQYLEHVVHGIVEKCARSAHVFIGDVMDADSKTELESSLRAFKATHGDAYPTKLYWDSELFVPERFFRYLQGRVPQLADVSRSPKIYSIENELTRFRYDVIARIDKAAGAGSPPGEHGRLDRRDIIAAAPQRAAAVSADTLAYVLHTSGSTGMPKGVGITHDNLANYLNWACREYFGDAAADMALFTPLTFDFTVTSLFCPLLTGGGVHVFSEPFRESAPRMFRGQGPVKVKLTPSHLAYLLEAGFDLSGIQVFILGGEALERRLLQRLAAAHPGELLVYNEYGPTEATVGCIVEKLSRERLGDDAPVKIGKPISGMTASIVDAGLRALAPGEKGEILLQGASVAPGYLDGAIADRFVELPDGRGRAYLTGDVGSMDEAGEFFYMGRKDDQLKILGHRVDPVEVAEALDALVGVIRAHVVGVRDGNGDTTLTAFLQIDRPLRARDIRAQLARVLPAYMLPTVFRRVEHFPTNANGKVDKPALLAVATELEPRTEDDGAADLTSRERQFLELVGGVLRDRTSQIALDASFADLGGDSIRAIMLVNALKRGEFDVKVNEVFELPTIRALMQAVTRRASGAAKEVRAFVGSFELLPIQRRFLGTSITGAEWFNNSVLIRSSRRLDPVLVQQAQRELMGRHELLRAVFLPAPDGSFRGEVLQTHEAQVCFTMHEVTRDEERRRVLQQLHCGFDLTHGPVFRIALLRDEQCDCLYVVAHHLVIDRVSWQIVLDDLERLLVTGQASQRQLRTSSPFGTWTAVTRTFFEGGARLETGFWRELMTNVDPRWWAPPSRVQDLALRTVRLDRTRSRELADRCRKLPGGLETLIAAVLGRALTVIWGGNEPLVMFESHGRHPEQIAVEMDLGQTVGWFTAQYPVKLGLALDRPLEDTLAETARRVRASKDRCLSYGFLREGTGRGEQGCRVGFNYLGDVRGATGAGFQMVEQEGIQAKSPYGSSEHELFMAAALTEAGLVLDVEYDTTRCDAQTIASLFERMTIEFAGLSERMARDADTSPVADLKASSRTVGGGHDGDVIVSLTPRRAELETLFFLHGAGGEVFHYRAVAKKLAALVNVLGVQARGIFEDAPLPGSRSELVQQYADAIAAAQPDGALSLCGYSLSSFIGYDVICALENRGRKVDRFVLIDNPIADIARDAETIERRSHVIVDQALRILLQLEENPFASLPTFRMIPKVFAHVNGSGANAGRFDEAFFVRYAKVVQGLYRCVMDWQPDGVSQASLHYIGAADRERDNVDLGGWGRWFAGTRSQCSVGCGHTEFFNPPNVEATARAIIAAIQRSPC